MKKERVFALSLLFDKEILPDIKKGYALRACITAYSAENSMRGVIKDNFSISIA